MSEQDQPLNIEISDPTPEQPANYLFTSNILWDDRAKETVVHLMPPKVIADGMLQLARKEDIVVINTKFIRKITTSVQVLEPENGHSRILT